MSLDVACSSCGQTLSAPSGLAGKKMPCPYCGEQTLVPGTPAPAAAPPAPDQAKPWQKSDQPSGQTNSGRSFEGKVLNGGVLGGMLAMVGAIVWFVLGLQADRIFFYPPVLFVIGLVAVFKGLTQGSTEE
jgi:DNA-directed RNA polymerase subunit RPC12/RpoP